MYICFFFYTASQLWVWNFLAPLAPSTVRQARNLRNFPHRILWPRCFRGFRVSAPSFLHVLNVSVVVEVSGQRCGELGRLAFLSSMGETEARKHILEMKGAKMMICNKTIRHWIYNILHNLNDKKKHDTYVHFLLKLVLTPWDECI